MVKEMLTFGDIVIEKKTFYCYKSLIFLKDIDIQKVLVSNKISFGGKIGYLHNDNKVKPLRYV